MCSTNVRSSPAPACGYTGNSTLCEDVLVEEGVTDLSPYASVDGVELAMDLFVDGVNPPGDAVD